MSYGDRQQTRVKRLRASLAAGLLGLAWSSLLVGPQAATATTESPLPASDYGVRPLCTAPAPGHAACLALELVPETPAARAHTRPLGMTRDVPANAGPSAGACTAANGCYGLGPQDLRNAYQLPREASSQQTIAIVDPFNDPSAEADLEKYSQEFGLPGCTKQNGCFQQVNEKGEEGKLPFPSAGERGEWEALCRTFKYAPKCIELEEAVQWDGEISLDIETAHGICQNCRILLVEAGSSKYKNLEEAEESAVRLGATEVSNSWGRPEPASESKAFNHPGVVITAAAGDEGYLNWLAPEAAERGSVEYPASSPHVVAVGGTRLRLQEGAWKEETVWNGKGATGGGCSQVFAAPEWQLSASDWLSVGCGEKRAVSDVSADGDPYTGAAAIYNSDSKCESHWCPLAGTSLASPLIAAVFALAGGAHGVEYPARTLYENERDSPGSLHDVVVGSNGECREPPTSEGLAGCSVAAEAASCSQQARCLAGVGYDGPSGVGTPNGIAAFEPPLISGAKQAGPAPPPQPAPPAPRTDPGQQAQQSGGGSPGPSATTPVTGPGRAGTIQVSGLALTPRAVIALHRTRPKPSQIGFSFSINGAAQVRATLARQVRIKGKLRWKPLTISLTIAASRGRNSRSLRGRNTLRAGIYRLTLAPSGGIAQSIVIKLR